MKLVVGTCGSKKSTVRITIDAGSSVEYGGNWTPGIAHLTEHMIFQGGEDFDSLELNREVASLGIERNAATWHGKVSFFIDGPAENMERGAELLAKMLLNRTFDLKSLENEKLVVLEEERGLRDDVDNVIFERFGKFLSKGPVAEPIAGTQDSIKSITLEELQMFYNYYYKPSKMLMTITGPEDLPTQKMGQCFGGDTGKFLKSKLAPNKQFKTKKLVVSATIKQARVFVSWNGYRNGSIHSLPLYFMSKFFSNGMDSRLFEEIRNKNGLCYGIGSHIVSEKDIGWFIIATRTAEENVKKTIKLLDNEIKKLLKYGPTEEEMFRARNKYISDIYSMIETSYGLNSVLEERAYSKRSDLETTINRIKNITAKQIMNTCRKTFTKEGRRIFVCLPEDEENGTNS